jgi:hypothetical protein
MTKKMKGALIATAVASLFAGSAFAGDKATKAPAKDDKAAAKVSCEGVNECKAKGECGNAEHECGGQNACKGKGWISLTEKECKAKGGKVLANAKKM